MNLTRAFLVTLGIVGVVLLRMLPHPPNMEPIMGSMMPFAKKYGWLTGTLFSFAAIFCYDILTGTAGTWTYATALSYAAIGLAAGFYFRTHKTITDYARFAFLGTIAYDLVTGVILGPVLFGGMTYTEALIGQIPFTAWHVLGNVLLAVTLSPAVEFVLEKIAHTQTVSEKKTV
jgi:uncharacterized membrane protein